MNELEKMLGSELYQSVMEKIGDKRLLLDEGNLIPKYRFDCVNMSLKEHKAKLTKVANENQELKNKIEKLKFLEEECCYLRREKKIYELISFEGAKNVVAVRSQIELKEEENFEKELKLKLRLLKRKTPYLFYKEEEGYFLLKVNKRK